MYFVFSLESLSSATRPVRATSRTPTADTSQSLSITRRDADKRLIFAISAQQASGTQRAAILQYQLLTKHVFVFADGMRICNDQSDRSTKAQPLEFYLRLAWMCDIVDTCLPYGWRRFWIARILVSLPWTSRVTVFKLTSHMLPWKMWAKSANSPLWDAEHWTLTSMSSLEVKGTADKSFTCKLERVMVGLNVSQCSVECKKCIYSIVSNQQVGFTNIW